MNNQKILAITKRPAELCATQDAAYAAGFGFIAATELYASLSVLRSVPIVGVVICKHSLSAEERDTIAAYLAEFHPDIRFARCPGCTNLDDTACVPGGFENIVPLFRLLNDALLFC